MQRVLALALRGSGTVSPNPRVGCVIVKNGGIIAEGWHREYGGLHAEADAIRNATEDISGATLYVNVEPCAHYGKQPPCANLIIEHGIRRVVVGMIDPFHQVNGAGVELLKNAGVEITTGVLSEECEWVNRAFTKFVTVRMPYLIAKTAQTIDGCIATARGESHWITGEESRRRVHILRSELDAVLVGKSTALSDNPSLDVRLVPGRNPRRVIFDTTLSLPLDLKLFTDNNRENTLVICNSAVSTSKKANILLEAGISIVGVSVGSDGFPDPKEALYDLANTHKIASVMVEGGGRILSSCFRDNLIDEFHFFVAPVIMGNGKRAFAEITTNRLSDMRQFTVKYASISGNDLHVIALRNQ